MRVLGILKFIIVGLGPIGAFAIIVGIMGLATGTSATGHPHIGLLAFAALFLFPTIRDWWRRHR
jgi:hypothetical protein